MHILLMKLKIMCVCMWADFLYFDILV